MYILILNATDKTYDNDIDINVAISDEKDVLQDLAEKILNELDLFNKEVSILSNVYDFSTFLINLYEVREKYTLLKTYNLNSIDYNFTRFKSKISEINYVVKGH